MGVLVNSIKEAKDMHMDLTQVTTGKSTIIGKYTKNAIENLDLGSKACPVVRECRDVASGIA